MDVTEHTDPSPNTATWAWEKPEPSWSPGAQEVAHQLRAFFCTESSLERVNGGFML